MNIWNYLRRSLFFFRRSHLWVILGCSVSTAILVGALVVGDSVRFSLKQIVFHRLGNTELALISGDRYFRSDLADQMKLQLKVPVAPLLQARGMATAEGGRWRANAVQIVGVDPRFGVLGGGSELYASLLSGEAAVNENLAQRLKLRPGDEFVLRVENLDAMPKDAPLALASDLTLARPKKVKFVAGDEAFGRFNLRADQVAPLSVFVPLDELGQDLGLEGRSNILLISGDGHAAITREDAELAFRKLWRLADAGLSLNLLEGRNTLELSSSRIFIEPEVIQAVSALGIQAQSILTYFVNRIRFEDRSVPYSFVSAAGGSYVPQDMSEEEILINDWLAQDLMAKAGDTVELVYFVLGPNRNLIEESAEFKVHGIVPLQGIYADPSLLPDFPGLSEIESTRDWRPGIPIDLDLIREKDELYWDRFRGTPKAFLTLKAGQEIWQNRFGNITAVRFEGKDAAGLEKDLLEVLEPTQLGYIFRELKQEGLAAGKQGVDFGQLFLGLSFFIIVAALLLTGLLFIFNVEKRSQEIGLLLALGFTKKKVKHMVLLEGAVLVFWGGILGSAAAMLYNQLVLWALKTVWQSAVGTPSLQMHVSPPTVLLGAAIGMGTAFFTIWAVAGRLVRKTITGLQKGLTQLDTLKIHKPRFSLWLFLISLVAVFVILITADFDRGRDAFGVFFAAGSLLLLAGVSLFNVLLFRLGRSSRPVRQSLFMIGIRGNARRRIRSLALIGLLASGLFIVFTVGANRQNAVKGAGQRESGTGGFALFGESTLPVLYDLNSSEGQRFYGLPDLKKTGVLVVSFRVRPGDDASCLNLNRVSQPRLLGVKPEELSERGAFRLLKMTPDVDPGDPWAVLERQLPDGSVPAIADNTVIVWGLGKAVGDTLEYQDENGETFKVKLVGGLRNSIFQGNLIISEKYFMEKYPSLSGTNLFLIDAPREKQNQVSGDLSWALQDLGLDLIPTSDRLAQFNQVENTYLSIFLILGSFGLILGSIGLGIVVGRNIKEREGELALLRAVGFSLPSLRKLILYEHMALLLAGVGLGLVSALLATLPAILTPGADIPYLSILVLLVFVLANGGIWTLTATRQATRGDLLEALRRE